MIRASTVSVSDLLRELLREPGAAPGKKAINPELKDEDIKTEAEKLVNSIIPPDPVDIRHYAPFIDIRCPDLPPTIRPETLRSWPIISGWELRSVFGYDGDLSNGATLADIIRPIDREYSNRYWIDDLANALNNLLINKQSPGSLITTFRGIDHQFYSPILFCVGAYHHSQRVEHIRVTFHQALTEPKTAAPSPLTALAATLRHGYRFRYEVLDLFEGATLPDEVDEVARLLKEMEIEEEQRGYSNPDARRIADLSGNPVYEAFEEKDRTTLGEIFLELRRYRAAPGDLEGLLDKALRARKPADLAKCLRALRPLNATFMRMGARCYAKLIAQEFKVPSPEPAHSKSTPKKRSDKVIGPRSPTA